MKLKLIIAFITVAFAYTSIAQEKITHGKITYTISYPEMDLDGQMAAMMPKEAILYFKEDASRMEIKSGFGNTISLSDNKKRETVTLMDMMGDKYAIRMNEEEMKKQAEKAPKPEVVLLDDTKKIAGYDCKKALVKLQDDDQEIVSTVFYTSDIEVENANWHQNQFSGIEGMMLEFDMNQNGMNMRMTAKEVKGDRPDDKLFTVPEGYKETTVEEIQRKYQGK